MAKVGKWLILFEGRGNGFRSAMSLICLKGWMIG
jgi:hypothetical protein